MTAIKTVDLTKKYKDVTADDRLNLEIEEGELFALLGVNGAGKTTTIKMLSTLTRPTEGDAFIMGHSILTDADSIKELDSTVSELDAKLEELLYAVPNIPHESVPEGADDKENVEIRR